MSIFEKIFEVFYCSAAIIWSCCLAEKVITDDDKLNLERLLSILIMFNLTAFILAKLSW